MIIKHGRLCGECLVGVHHSALPLRTRVPPIASRYKGICFFFCFRLGHFENQLRPADDVLRIRYHGNHARTAVHHRNRGKRTGCGDRDGCPNQLAIKRQGFPTGLPLSLGRFSGLQCLLCELQLGEAPHAPKRMHRCIVRVCPMCQHRRFNIWLVPFRGNKLRQHPYDLANFHRIGRMCGGRLDRLCGVCLGVCGITWCSLRVLQCCRVLRRPMTMPRRRLVMFQWQVPHWPLVRCRSVLVHPVPVYART